MGLGIGFGFGCGCGFGFGLGKERVHLSEGDDVAEVAHEAHRVDPLAAR